MVAAVTTATAAGWQWDQASVRAHLGRSEVAGLLAARAGALPAPSRQVAEAMACLGGRAELSLLQAATGETADAVDQALAPALGEGLLVAEPGAQEAVRFRHDRIREDILRGMDPPRRRSLQLAMARRLAAVPEMFATAAGQYLPAASAIDDPAERRVTVALLRRAASQAALIGDYALVNALLAAALSLIDPGETATLIEVHTGRHAALYGLGRLEEADEEYRAIERLCPTAMRRADATRVQVHSLTHRKRYAEALGLGLESLREFGITVPAGDRLPAGDGTPLVMLHGWGQTQAMFCHQFAGLAPDRRVVTLDQRGHGQSAKPRHGYRIARLARDAHELLDHLAIDHADVLGWSMGVSVW